MFGLSQRDKLERVNIDIVSRFTTDFLGRGLIAVADDVLAPGVQGITGLKPDGPINGREEYKQIFAGFFDAFPPAGGLDIIDQFAANDRVVTRFRARQRHAKDYFGIAATQRVILFDETHVARVKDGLIVENVVSATNLEFEMLMAPVLAPMILK